MAKLKISLKFRAQLSEKLMDLGNLAAAALTLGQFINNQGFSVEVFFYGIVFAVACYVISYIISS